MRRVNGTVGLLLVFLMTACSAGLSGRPIGFEEQISGGNAPVWTLTPYREDTREAKAFCGTSHNFGSDAEARDNALQNARKQIIDAMGTYGTHLVEQVISSVGTAGSILDPGLVVDDATKMISDAMVKTRAREFHVEKWARKTHSGVEYFFRTNVLVLWNNADAEEAVQSALRSQAESKADEEAQRNIDRALETMERLRSENW